MTRAAILTLLLFAACTDPPAHVGTATVYTYPTGAVVFHGSDGRVLDTVMADLRGKAEGPMEPGGMVTYHLPTLTELWETHGDVQPGDTLVSPNLDDPPQRDVPTSALMFEVTPLADPTVNLVRVDVACGTQHLEFAAYPTQTSFTLDIPQSCLVEGKVFVQVYPIDHVDKPLAFATDTVPVPGRMTIGAWRTDFAATPVAIAAETDLYSNRLDVLTRSSTVTLYPSHHEVTGPRSH